MALNIDLPKVVSGAVSAAAQQLGSSFNTVAPDLSHAISVLAQTEIYINDPANGLSPERKAWMESQQKLATQNILLAYEGVGLLSAELAVNAAVNVIMAAITVAIGAATGGIV